MRDSELRVIHPDYATAVAFLEAWHPGGPWSVGAIDPDDHNGLAWLTTYETAELWAFLQDHGARRRNLYYQLNLCRPDLGSRRAGKDHVVMAVGVHADIDPPDLATLDALRAWQLEMAARLDAPSYWASVGLPGPSAIVFSGTGFQPLWRLAEPLVLWAQAADGQWRPDPGAVEAIEGRCVAILRRVDPLHTGTHNVDRLMRLPGTLNWPNAQKRRRGRVDPELALVAMAGTRHALDVFPHEPVPRTAGRAVVVQASVGQRVPLEQLRGALPGWLLSSIVDGAPPGADRSKVGFSTICALLRSGIDDAGIAAIALDPAYKISGHYLDQGDPERAVNRALVAAHSEVDPELAELAEFQAAIARWATPAAPTAPTGAAQGPPNPAPSDVEIDAALRSAQKRLSQRKDADSLRDAELIKRVRGGEFLTDGSPDGEERRRALALAAIAVARAAPPGIAPSQLERRLLASAGVLAPDVPQVVEMAIGAAAAMPPLLSGRESRTRSPHAGTPAPGDDDDDGPLDEFVLEASGPRQGQPIASAQHNFEVALRRLGITFSLDLFAYRKYIVQDGVEKLVDEDIMKKIPTVIEKKFGFSPPKEKFRDSCDVAAYDNSYHPVRDWLDALPPHDGESRLDTWLIRLGGAKDTPYVRAVSRIVLVAAVRRIRQPGSKFDEMLILEGGQGTEKSTLIRSLCAHAEWFGPKLPFNGNDRDRMEATSGKWIVEAGELAGMNQRDHRELKDYLQRQEDEARMAYAREYRRVLRQFIVIGSTNDTRYLRDITGNRRYWPVKLLRCDVAGLLAELDQLWSEAAAAEAAGESIRLAESLWAEAGVEQEQRRLMDPFEIALGPLLEDLHGMIQTEDVWKLCGFVDKRPSPGEQQRVSDVMTRLGWSPSRRARDKTRRYCYVSDGVAEHWLNVVAGAGGWRCVAENATSQGSPSGPARSISAPN